MISRKVVVWLIAVIWVAIALFVWLGVLGPSNLPVIIAEPAQAGTELDGWVGRTPQPARFTVHNARAENLGRLGEAVTPCVTAGLDLPTADRNGRTCAFSSALLGGQHLIAQIDADGISTGADHNKS